MKPSLPFVPGVEVSGHIRAAPPESGLTVGSAVMGFTVLGGFAEIAAADPAMVVPLHDGLPLQSGGGFLMNYHTAHFALARRGRVRPGDTVAVHGAAGSVGTAAIQVARGLGAHVVALTSSEAKAGIASRAGAHEVVDVAGDWSAALRGYGEG